MRPASKHSRNVLESIREEKEEGHFATTQHSHPEVSFSQGDSVHAPPESPRHLEDDGFSSDPSRNGSTPPGDDLASMHEQHARQIEAIGHERNKLARQLAEVIRDLAQARKDHAEELERTRLERDDIIKAKENLGLQLVHVRDHQREQAEGFTAERIELTAERDQLTAQLAEWRARHQSETEALTRDHKVLSTTLAQEREQRHRELAALTAQNDQLKRERGELSAELDRTRMRLDDEVSALITERDALRGTQEAMSRTTTERLELHKTQLADLCSQLDRMTQERYRVSSEFSTFREGHRTAIDALTNERDQLRAAQAELRAHLTVLKEGHQTELDELRREHSAVLKEADEVHELLSTDRLAAKKQVELFAAERETLCRERDEALADLIHERQSEARQVDLRTEECNHLLAQRAEMQGQIEELRAAEQRQNALFHEERKILCEERDHTAAKLAQCLEALGEDRMTLLEQKTGAETRLEAAKREHAGKVAALEAARVEVAGQRDAALRELAVFHDAQAREQSFFGASATRKLELDSTTERVGLRMKTAAKDTALARDVAVHMIHGGGTSDERRAELIEEGRHFARLQHPNIPPIYEAGFDADGQVFYTTKAVTGTSLREVLNELERGKTSSLLHFSLRRLLSVFHRICDAVSYAHAREIAHGDLKPEHIVLGEFGEVFVTGWSPPRRAGAEGEAVPEFHPRDDITALGRILYEMTNLLHPPETDASGNDTGRQVKNAAKRAWAGDKDVNALAAIAQRALNPKVAGRFFSVRELQKQVDAFKDSFDDPSRVTLKTILRQWVYLHRRKLIIAAILLTLALAGGLWMTQQLRTGAGTLPSMQTSDRLELLRPPPR